MLFLAVGGGLVGCRVCVWPGGVQGGLVGCRGGGAEGVQGVTHLGLTKLKLELAEHPVSLPDDARFILGDTNRGKRGAYVPPTLSHFPMYMYLNDQASVYNTYHVWIFLRICYTNVRQFNIQKLK